jgi:hypothetical protein
MNFKSVYFRVIRGEFLYFFLPRIARRSRMFSRILIPRMSMFPVYMEVIFINVPILMIGVRLCGKINPDHKGAQRVSQRTRSVY